MTTRYRIALTVALLVLLTSFHPGAQAAPPAPAAERYCGAASLTFRLRERSEWDRILGTYCAAGDLVAVPGMEVGWIGVYCDLSRPTAATGPYLLCYLRDTPRAEVR